MRANEIIHVHRLVSLFELFTLVILSHSYGLLSFVSKGSVLMALLSPIMVNFLYIEILIDSCLNGTHTCLLTSDISDLLYHTSINMTIMIVPN